MAWKMSGQTAETQCSAARPRNRGCEGSEEEGVNAGLV